MKIWLKFLIASVLGITIGMLLPAGNSSVASALAWLEKFALGIGRYAVVPVLFFSLTHAVYEFRKDNQLGRILLKNILFIAISSAAVIFSGIIITLIFSPLIFSPERRIGIETVEQIEVLTLGTSANFLDVFPSNMFHALVGNGLYLFPVFAFAFFLGLGLGHDKIHSRPVLTIVDSLSRIFYRIASFFTEIIAFVLIVLAAYWAYRYNGVLQLQGYRGLIVMLGIFSIVLCFGIFPLFLYTLKPKVNPWMILYGSLASAFASFFSGDFNFSIPVLQRHLKENFGVRRRSSALSLALFSTFCRGGSAMVAASAFIIIIRLYNPALLGITMIDFFVIGLYAFVISFLLARHPGAGAYIALAALSVGFGGGEYRAGYLILKPLAFYLIAVGTFIDVMLTAFGTYYIAKTNDYIEEPEKTSFI